MIFLTGDTHGDFSRLRDFAQSERGKKLNKDDVVIVLGDFGIWEETLEEIKRLDSELPYTLAFLDGNHEDHALLAATPVSRAFGGEVQSFGGVLHLCRGELFFIPCGGETRSVLVCGGGESRDKEKRTAGVDWFPEESVSEGNVERTLKNAEKLNNRVDLFLTHSPSSAVRMELYAETAYLLDKPVGNGLPTESEYKIRDMTGVVSARRYCCGHEHIDREFNIARKHFSVVYTAFEEC